MRDGVDVPVHVRDADGTFARSGCDPLDGPMAGVTVMVQRLGVSDDRGVYRGHLRTITDALRALVEVAVTIGDPDSDAQAAASS